MLSVEYVTALAATVVAFSAAGTILSPAIADYQSDLRQELLETRALIQELETMCPAPQVTP